MLRHCAFPASLLLLVACTTSSATHRADEDRDAAAGDVSVSIPRQTPPDVPRRSEAGVPVSNPGPLEPTREPSGESTLSARYSDDVALAQDASVLFFDDFEQSWGRWDSPTRDTEHLFIERDGSIAHGGERYLRSTVTRQQLTQDEYISSAPSVAFPRRVDTLYFRYYVRFPVLAPNPHHWLRLEAGDEDYAKSGLANTVPLGDEGFWFDFDINNDDVFNFYVYWYEMRSGRCNDGSTTPGCAGDQGSTYHYGNVFRPAGQTSFARDQWLCIEIAAGANTVGETDGWLAFWVDDELVGKYEPGAPVGTWLRDSFHEGGCDFSACTDPEPFEGFDFRAASDVQFKRLILDAYYERGSSEDRRGDLEERGLELSDEYTILYDDVLVATERIGCGR